MWLNLPPLVILSGWGQSGTDLEETCPQQIVPAAKDLAFQETHTWKNSVEVSGKNKRTSTLHRRNFWRRIFLTANTESSTRLTHRHIQMSSTSRRSDRRDRLFEYIHGDYSIGHKIGGSKLSSIKFHHPQSTFNYFKVARLI